jgi:ribosome-associated toxin RatA of RatAB toxin-antitoxin module
MTVPVTVDEIVMRADPDRIFEAAAAIERWPSFLPHYRWVKVLGQAPGGRIVEMAARRGLIPVKWTSVQDWDSERREVYYEHVGGATRGMQVMWEIIPRADEVLVRIIHELRLEVPIVNSPPGRLITSRLFIRHIAGRTLWHMKGFVEGVA